MATLPHHALYRIKFITSEPSAVYAIDRRTVIIGHSVRDYAPLFSYVERGKVLVQLGRVFARLMVYRSRLRCIRCSKSECAFDDVEKPCQPPYLIKFRVRFLGLPCVYCRRMYSHAPCYIVKAHMRGYPHFAKSVHARSHPVSIYSGVVPKHFARPLRCLLFSFG